MNCNLICEQLYDWWDASTPECSYKDINTLWNRARPYLEAAFGILLIGAAIGLLVFAKLVTLPEMLTFIFVISAIALVFISPVFIGCPWAPDPEKTIVPVHDASFNSPECNQFYALMKRYTWWNKDPLRSTPPIRNAISYLDKKIPDNNIIYITRTSSSQFILTISFYQGNPAMDFWIDIVDDQNTITCNRGNTFLKYELDNKEIDEDFLFKIIRDLYNTIHRDMKPLDCNDLNLRQNLYLPPESFGIATKKARTTN